MTTVLITDAGRGTALAFIRSLADAGHRVIAADHRRISAGCWSRSRSGCFRYPDPYANPSGAARAIAAGVSLYQVDIVIPITDATARVVETIRGLLPQGCRVGLPPASAASVAADKGLTLRLAADLGVPVPKTVLVESAAEAVDAATAIGWPVVVKPVASLRADDDGRLRKFQVGYGLDADDVRRKFDTFGRGDPVLLQQYCRGEGIGVEVLADRGNVLRSFSHRRLHEVPVTGGASALRMSVAMDPQLLDFTTRLMAALEWTGLAMVEFKVGEDGPRLMEINGRPWGSLPLAVRSGVDFPVDYVRLLTGSDPTAWSDRTEPYETGVVARNLALEVVWIGSVLRGKAGPDGQLPGANWPSPRAAFASFARLFSPKVHDDVLSIRDPLPAVAELTNLAVRLLTKLSPAR